MRLTKTLCLLCLLSLASMNASLGAVAGYTFAPSSGTYTAIAGTTLFSGTWDDGNSALLTLPFTFTYNNTAYTTVGVNSNGFLTMGAVTTTVYCGLQTSAPNSIAGYATDLVGSATSTISYTTLGVSPNRQFVVQWADCDHWNNALQNHLYFQIVLNENGNTVQVIYGACTAATSFGPNQCADTNTESGDVGLLGAGTSDFNLRSVTNATTTWATSTPGAAITAVCNIAPTNLPANGLTWTWTPPVPTPMVFVSSTTTFINNAQVDPRGSLSNAILRVQVDVTGNLTPFTLSSIALSTTGSANASADIANAKVFYTGSSAAFATTTQYGSTFNNPNGAYTVNGTSVLQEGSNYFWITYDVRVTANLAEAMSGCCTQLNGTGTMGARTPTVTCPAGSHTVGDVLGSWSALTTGAPHANAGVMILLSDGTVMCKTSSGGAGTGNIWDRLTPNATGSYQGGAWTSLAPMIDTRLYFSSQVLKDGRVYVCGGEYGTGGSAGEVYDPLLNTWTATPAPGAFVSDANSVILEDGRVLQALVSGTLRGNVLYTPGTNTFGPAPSCIGIHNESSWVKLPDNSVLFVDRLTTNSERYIPATNTWVADATVPVALYDPFGLETGPAFLLNDGRAFFIGSSSHTAFYAPSGGAANGTWTAGPDVPAGRGAPDAAGAVMVNGKVICAVSPPPTSADHFPSPTYFYEFDPATNVFALLTAPNGSASQNSSCYITNMLDLPDGKVLYCAQGSSQYYLYTPAGAPTPAGKPVIANVDQIACGTYRLTGTGFNGLTEGAYYGDDWQMSTNYPVIRLTSGANVYYARTFNWNSTGVRRGLAADSARFTLPAGLPLGTYSLVVTANGIASDPVSFTTGAAPAISIAITAGSNPTSPGASITFTATTTNGGVPPAYQWKVNGGNAGTNSATFTTTTLTNGQVVTCVVTSSLPCASPTTAISNAITILVNGASVSPRAFLEGPFVSGLVLMHDSLRVKGLIPLLEPYTAAGYVHSGGGGGETTTAPVLAVAGSNAIVDWVLVELRSSSDPAVVLASHAALIQRDGDVVATNGTSPVTFTLAPANYYVVVRHRNHFGAMTATAVALGSVSTTIDFTSSGTLTYGSNARKAIGAVQVLWAGNTVFDHTLAYTGASNDRDPVLLRIGGTIPTATVVGYWKEDVTMDGTVKYTGAVNDRDPILSNIGGVIPTNTTIEQLP